MAVEIAKPQDQAAGAFDNGNVLERKPIGFPYENSKVRSFSTLFYWAHAWTGEEVGEIALHPHKGFEIATFVLTGSVEHYDTSSKKWNPLNAGDAQIIRSGSGISHAEKMHKNSSIFQIWFDPGLEQTLKIPPSYSDYRREVFPVETKDGVTTTTLIGETSPLECLSKVKAYRKRFPTGKHSISGLSGSRVGLFIMEGSLTMDNTMCEKGDFITLQQETDFGFLVSETSVEIFLIQVPESVNYTLYTEHKGLQ